MSANPSSPTAQTTDTTRAGPPRRIGLLILVLAGLTAVAPFATDMYIPAFPDMSRDLGSSTAAVQLSLTGFLVGLAVGQLLLGPISDSVGRRPVLIAGSALFMLLSAICAVAPSVEILNSARLLQGIMGAAGIVVARAVISDLFQGTAAAKHFATLSVIVFVAPVAAPLLGGGILSFGTWRVVFGVLALFGLILLALVLTQVPESLPEEHRKPSGVGTTLASVGGLLTRRSLMGYVLAMSFGSAGLFAYISGSTFVFQDVYGLSPTQYSLVFGINAFGMMLSGMTFGKLAARVSLNALLVIGIAIALVATAALAAILVTVGSSMITTWVCLFVLVLGIGTAFPAAMTLGQAMGQDAPGSVSGLLGSGQFLLGALASPVPGLFGTSSALPLALVIFGSFVLAALAVTVLARPWQRQGEAAPSAT